MCSIINVLEMLDIINYDDDKQVAELTQGNHIQFCSHDLVALLLVFTSKFPLSLCKGLTKMIIVQGKIVLAHL